MSYIYAWWCDGSSWMFCCCEANSAKLLICCQGLHKIPRKASKDIRTDKKCYADELWSAGTKQVTPVPYVTVTVRLLCVQSNVIMKCALPKYLFLGQSFHPAIRYDRMPCPTQCNRFYTIATSNKTIAPGPDQPHTPATFHLASKLRPWNAPALPYKNMCEKNPKSATIFFSGSGFQHPPPYSVRDTLKGERRKNWKTPLGRLGFSGKFISS